MPLTLFQKEVLRLLAAQRQPESHVGGGAVINRSSDSPRFSADIDIFHDLAESVIRTAETDAAVLVQQGYEVEWLLRQPFLQRAKVQRGEKDLRLD